MAPGASLSDCQADLLLLSAQTHVAALEAALSAHALPSTIFSAADKILEPIKPVLFAYGNSQRTDAEGVAIRRAVWGLAEPATFFEQQQVPGASAPASGVGSAGWALSELQSASTDIEAVTRLLGASSGGQTACP